MNEEAPQPSRDYAQICDLLHLLQHAAVSAKDAAITENAIAIAEHAFLVLAEAEAEMHNTTVDRVHFHEVQSSMCLTLVTPSNSKIYRYSMS